MVSVDSGQNPAQDVLAQISAAVDNGDLKRAGQLANQAIGRGLRHPTAFNARGLALQASGYHQDAIKDFEVANALRPHNATLHNAMGVSYLAMSKGKEALEQFDAALKLNPRHAPTHHRRGLAQAMLGNHEQAEASHTAAVALDPNHVDALTSLASIAARKRQGERTRMLTDKVFALRPDDMMASYALASLDHGEGKHVEAEARLRKLLSNPALQPQSRASALGLLGDTLDGQGRYREAFECYVQENADLRKSSAEKFEGRAADTIKHMTDYLRTTDAAKWAESDGYDAQIDGGPEQHIFLLGFMRSGTTLLEQVLASNPQVLATEERSMLNEAGRVFQAGPDAMDELATLDVAGLRHFRKAYWDRVREFCPDLRGKVYVDKQPLNTIKLPIIAKLFPKAKILFALRDPRDVVFSCFRRHFRVNITMFEFLDLKDTAEFYAGVMALGDISRQKLPLDVFEHRYEDMVGDFETQVRAVCDFIGIAWSDSMREFNKLAPVVDLRSPSAIQVRRPLYAEGIGQWRNYADDLAPVLPILAPWVEKFGYPKD
jgi:tetratricopeptide (TPR) repeat protein